jgi:hypothetical protein
VSTRIAAAGLGAALVTLAVAAASPRPAAAAPAVAYAADPCASRYPAGASQTIKISHGTSETFDRSASLYQVCEGFGAPDSAAFKLTPAMQCALIAAAAVYGGPVVAEGTSVGCEVGSIGSELASGHFLGAAKGVVCGFFSDVFAGSAGLFAAGATSETGPGAVAIGVNTYRALKAGLKLACGGVLTDAATQLGIKLEAKHETAVALDIIRRGRCLRETSKTLVGIHWAAATCPPQAAAGTGGATRSAPVLGGHPSTPPGQEGFGQVRPATVSRGGDPTSLISAIHWRSWGGARAVGSGRSTYVWPGTIVADNPPVGATIVAFQLGTCHGRPSYNAVAWYFPQYGQSFDPDDYIPTCPGAAPGRHGHPPTTRDCPDVRLPDGSVASDVSTYDLACPDAVKLIGSGRFRPYLQGGRWMQDGFRCGTDGPDGGGSTFLSCGRGNHEQIDWSYTLG